MQNIIVKLLFKVSVVIEAIKYMVMLLTEDLQTWNKFWTILSKPNTVEIVLYVVRRGHCLRVPVAAVHPVTPLTTDQMSPTSDPASIRYYLRCQMCLRLEGSDYN